MGVSSHVQAEVAEGRNLRLAVHPLVRDLGVTTAGEAAVLIAGVLVVSAFGRWLGAAALAEYLLLRRVVALLQPGVQLGLPLAVARQVAVARGRGTPDRLPYLTDGLLLASALALVLGITLNLAPEQFAGWLFGDAGHSRLILPLWLLLVGLAAQQFVYCFHQGQLALGRAALVHVSGLALVPLTVVAGFAWTGSVALIVQLMGALTLLAALLLAPAGLWSTVRAGLRNHTDKVRELLRYGIPRLPGDLGLAAFLALGPILAAHRLSLADVSPLLIGQTFLTLGAAALTPLGLVLLPKLSQMLAQNREAEVRERLGLLVSALVDASLFVCLQLVVFADVVIELWLGSGFLAATPVVRLTLLALPFYLIYVGLRSAINAASVRAYNTENVLLSLGLFLLAALAVVKLAPAAHVLAGIALSQAAAMVPLGLVALATARRLYKLIWPHGSDLTRAAIAVGFGALAFLARELGGGKISLPRFLAIEVLTCAAFLGLLVALRTPWLLSLWQMANGTSGSVTRRAGTERDA